MRLFPVLFVPFAVFLADQPSGPPVPRSAEPLHGAWRIIQSSLTTGETKTTNASPQPGLVLFTDRHYSLMYVEGQLPRKPFTDPIRPTDAEKLEAYETFVGHSGTYSVSDTLIAMEVVISKWPNLMGTELRTSFARFAYHIGGDTLRLTRRSPRAVFTMTLLRVE